MGNKKIILSKIAEILSWNGFFPRRKFQNEEYKKLANRYELLGLSISTENSRVLAAACMASNEQRISDLFSVENWLKQEHSEVYDAYKSAIDAYAQGHAGACIESCRTCLVSIFFKYKETEGFARWMRGVYNISGDGSISTLEELSHMCADLHKDDLADFFYENRAGKLTKTKTIYMIYSMMSDYGTHRNESAQEKPAPEDALFSLRLTDSILLWVYSKKK